MIFLKNSRFYRFISKFPKLQVTKPKLSKSRSFQDSKFVATSQVIIYIFTFYFKYLESQTTSIKNIF